MKKITFALFGVITISSALFFLMSMKQYNPYNVPCEERPARDARIKILFSLAPYQFRTAGNEYFIPSPDLRWGDAPGNWVHESDKYFCLVTITSPNCPAYNWQQALTSSGIGSNGMAVKLPPEGYDVTLKVEYWEKGDANVPGFNLAPTDSSTFFGPYIKSRLKYTFQQTYLGGWGSSIPQPVYLNVTSNNGYFDNGDIIFEGGKTAAGDLSSLNEYINMKP